MKTIELILLLSILGNSCVGQIWESLNGGTSYAVRDMKFDANLNRLFVVGQFEYVGQEDDELMANGFAMWDSISWSTSESLFPNSCQFGSCDQINSVEIYQDRIIVAGYNSSINEFQIHEWNGTVWQLIGVPDGPGSLCVLENQLFYVGDFTQIDIAGIQNIAVWNGVNWDPFSSPNPFQSGDALTEIDYFYEEYYVAGNFEIQNQSNEILRWSNGSWNSVGSGILGDSWINSIEVFSDLLFIGGNFHASEGNVSSFLLAWDGTSFINPFSNVQFISPVRDIIVVNQELYILGDFYLNDQCCIYSIAKYNGDELCGFGGYSSFPDINTAASKIAATNSDLYIAGNYIHGTNIDHIASIPLNTISDTCVLVDSNVHVSYGQKYKFGFYPNPCGSQLVFFVQQLTGNVDVTIYNLSGQRMESISIMAHENRSIDVSHLSPGIYFVRITTSAGLTATEKLIIN